MAIGLSYIDATFLDLSTVKGVFQCKRFSAPFMLIERNGDTVCLKGMANGNLWQQGRANEAVEAGSVYERSMSLDVLSLRFDTLSIDGLNKPKLYCLKQPIVNAVEMTCNFGVNVLCDETEDFEYRTGERGDFVVESMMGYNTLVKKADFDNIYQVNNLDLYLCRASNIIKAVRNIAASKGSSFEVSFTV